jgi:hypothetical protein
MCLIWWQRLFILKSAMLSWLELSSQHVSSCNVSFLKPSSVICCVFVVSYALISYSPGICLEPIAEDRRVSEWVAALERVASDTNTFWIDPRHRSAIVLLQDRVQHVRESVDGCQKSLTTMYSVMLPRNPPPENFGQLLKVFRTSRRSHRLIELILVAGANFALG